MTEAQRNRYAKAYAELKFTDDFLFCKILENNPDLCKELLELILEIKIREIKRISKQKVLDGKYDGKGIRLDVYAEDDDNSVFDIEMQTTKQKYLPKRTRYYQGMIDMDLIQKGEEYKVLKRSYVIFICLSDPFGLGYPVYHFENRCLENKELVLGDDEYKVFINAEGIRDRVSDDMKDFLDFLQDVESGGNSGFVRKLKKEVKDARDHKEWREQYMTIAERDEYNREEGREEGRKEGREEGRLIQLIELVDEGDISEEKAAQRAGLTLDEFRKKKQELSGMM